MSFVTLTKMKTVGLPLWIFRRGCIGVALLFWVAQLGAGAEIIPAERRIDWTLAGHPGGIPTNRPVWISVRDSSILATYPQFYCYGDGTHDDTTAIYKAIQACPLNQVIYFPAGNYRITSRINAQQASSITLRGDGPGQTVFVCDFPGASDAFNISNGEIPLAADILNIASGYTRGSSNIVLAGTKVVNETTTFAPAVGRLILIDQLNDGSIVTEVGAQGVGTTKRATVFDIHRQGLRNQAQLVKITAMSSPTNINFWPPLYISFNASLSPQISVINPTLTAREIGIEDLTFTNKSNTHNFVVLNTSENCWLKNVEFRGSVSAPLLASTTLGLEVRDCFHNGGALFSDCVFYLQVCHNFKFENNVCNAGGFIFNGCAGGVVSYNFFTNNVGGSSEFLFPAINLNHGAHSYMNLFEGNVAGGYFQADYYWGSSGLNTFFRNRVSGMDNGATINRKCLALDRNSLSNNAVGNVLGNPIEPWRGIDANPAITYPYEQSFIYRLGYPMAGNNGFASNTNAADGYDPRVKATLLRHGNYDYASTTTTWDPANSVHALPDSLYLSGRPNWWGTGRWPPIGGDLSPLVSEIPAQLRYKAPLTLPIPPGNANKRLITP